MSKKRPRSPWKQVLEAERLRALERPHARRLPDAEANEEVRTASRQSRFGPRP